MTHPRPFRFGIQLSQADTGAQWLDDARRAEALGYDALLMPDHFGSQFGPFAGLSAAAAVTSTIRLGLLVAANDFRHPLVLAKEAATVDVISGGRFELGLGAGWDGADYTQTGMPLDAASERTDRLTEAVTVLKSAFTGEPFSFSGKHYQITGATAGPVPVQRPHPPLMIGAGAPRLLGLAGREADIATLAPRTRGDGTGLIVSSATAEATDRKIAWIRDAAGPRFDRVELGALIFGVVVTENPKAAAEEWAVAFDTTADSVLGSPHVLIGSIQSMADELRGHRERFGISYWVVQDMQPFAEVAAKLAGT
jgi:probable F420-dependent oxidoreductase